MWWYVLSLHVDTVYVTFTNILLCIDLLRYSQLVVSALLQAAPQISLLVTMILSALIVDMCVIAGKIVMTGVMRMNVVCVSHVYCSVYLYRHIKYTCVR